MSNIKPKKYTSFIPKSKLTLKNRLNSKSLFLTYPTNKVLNKHNVQTFLELKFKHNIHFYIISEETSDIHHGYEHIHVLITLNKRCDIKYMHSLDIQGIHGEYQATRNIPSVITYITKQDKYPLTYNINLTQFILNKISDPFQKFSYKVQYLREDPYSLLRQAHEDKTYDSFNHQLIVDYAKNPTKYDRFIAKMYKTLHKPLYYPMYIYEPLFDDIMNWARSITDFDDFKTLYIYGRSGTGKTSLARTISQDRSLIVKDRNALKQLNVGEHLCIIFDDLSELYTTNTAEDNINLLNNDIESQIRVTYGISRIPATLAKIVTSYRHPNNISGYSESESLSRRIHILDLDKYQGYTPIYHPSHPTIKKPPEHLMNKYIDISPKTFQKFIEFLIKKNTTLDESQDKDTHDNL